jgi:enoyl-CoA hydratase/carnithine racemase
MNDIVLLKEEENGVVTLTLNRPEVMNSFNFQLLHALKEQIESVRFNRDIRVVIITAAGEKAFCAGADLKERATLSPDQVKEFIFTIRNLFTSIEQLNKAVIAAVNGVALGGGTELALACDIRLASMNASMGLTETRLAIIVWQLYRVQGAPSGCPDWWEEARPKSSFLPVSESAHRRR